MIKNEKVHSLKTVLTECETTHNYANRHWKGDHAEVYHTHDCHMGLINKFIEANGKYIDFHSWRFIPEKFEFIVNSLYKMGFISLKIEMLYCTKLNDLEFFAVLYK